MRDHSNNDPWRLGPYELRREAGRGGMATVYDATDTRDGRRVAVKVLTYVSEQSPEERNKQQTRLRREALAISRIKHPHIVQMYDVEITSENPRAAHYLVMEFVEGETLKSRLYRDVTLAPEDAVTILEQIADALDTVHGADIVHRDLKPSNIMLLLDGTAKLMDFGVARLTDDTMVTRTGMVVGSPAYMSPEQATSQPVGAASDLWSLTSVFFEMLAGHPAFHGDSIPAVLYQVAYGQPAPLPTNTLPEVQSIFARFQPVFNRAFEREPSERFSSAGALAAAFRAALEGKTLPQETVRNEKDLPSRRLSLSRWAPAILIPVFLGFFALSAWLSARARSMAVSPVVPQHASPATPRQTPEPPEPIVADSEAAQLQIRPKNRPTAAALPPPASTALIREMTPLPAKPAVSPARIKRKGRLAKTAKSKKIISPRKNRTHAGVSRRPSAAAAVTARAPRRSVPASKPSSPRQSRPAQSPGLFSPKTVLRPGG